MKIQPSKLEELSENWFLLNREEFAAMLAAGETLVAHGDPVLEFEDIENAIIPDHLEEFRSCLKLCAIEPATGGKHMRKLLETVAQKLVDDFQDGFRASYEEEINQKDAA